MQIAHILPTDLLYLIENRNFYMCLANIAIQNTEYLNFYKRKSKEGKFILLDNGEAEQQQLSLDTMLDIIKEINPSEIILNDTLNDRKQTIEKSNIALDYYKSKGYNNQFMFVTHGIDFNDWWLNFKEDIINHIHTIGIPKTITNTWNKELARYDCCKFLLNTYYNIHLLGCNESLDILKLFKNLSNVRSIDTSLSYIKAKSNEQINKGQRPLNIKMDFINHQLNDIELLKYNIQTFDKLIIT